MKKRAICIILILTMLFTTMLVLTGCGEVAENNDNKEKNNNSEENNIENTQETELSLESVSGSFVKYNDNIYFWKLSENSRESTALFANYNDIVTAKNTLVKRDKDGNEEIILTDRGSGDIYILNNKIFLNYAENEYGTIRKIYSVDLKGENKIEYQQGEIKSIIGDYIICQTEENGNIFRINSKNGQIENLKTKANFIGAEENIIYYSEIYDYKKAILNIGSITDNKDNGIIATIKSSEFQGYSQTPPIEITKYWYKDNKVNMYIGYRLGTANMLQEVIHLSMDKNGENIKKVDASLSEDSDLEQPKNEVYLKAVQKNGTYQNNLMYINESDGLIKELMTEEDISKKFNLLKDDEHYISIYCAEIIDNDAYIVLDYSEHYPAEDIGWRYSYKRLKTICFKYNIKTNEIKEVYQF